MKVKVFKAAYFEHMCPNCNGRNMDCSKCSGKGTTTVCRIKEQIDFKITEIKVAVHGYDPIFEDDIN